MFVAPVAALGQVCDVTDQILNLGDLKKIKECCVSISPVNWDHK